ncbi:MAG: hypothetical protein IT373_26945 [Polyangiaceae bacterium]|nr:hypothetical protein [Polyangiaceae bacterium]
MHKPALVLAACALGLVACRGDIVVTAELHGPGTVEVRLPVTSQRLALWADTDGKWHGSKHLLVRYEIDVLQEGKTIGHVSCSTNDVSVSVCGTTSNIGGAHSGDCEMKMNCQLPGLAESGEVVLRVTAQPGDGVDAIDKISLNVRKG